MYPVSNGAHVVAADLNGDGVLDLAVTDSEGVSIFVLLGLGDGTFQQPVRFGIGSSAGGPGAISVGDFNGDGLPDIVTTSDSVTRVFPGRGDGSFGTPLSYAFTDVFVADFDGDGLSDFALSNSQEISIVLNAGNGRFHAPLLATPGTGRVLGARDFNNDGKLDLLFEAGGQLGVLLGNGNGSFGVPIETGVYSDYGSIGDFNEDGVPDIALVHGSSLIVLLGAGDGTFRPAPTALPGSIQDSPLIVGDFDGDGHLDIVTPWGVAMGHGDGSFGTPGFLLPLNPGRASIVGTAGDFNGDGRSDLATAGVQVFLATIDPPTITLPDGIAGTDYDEGIPGLASVNDFNFYVSAGSLPAGLTLTSFGEISGRPSQAGVFQFTVSGTQFSCPLSRLCALTIHDTSPIPVITGVEPPCLSHSQDFIAVVGSGFVSKSSILSEAPFTSAVMAEDLILGQARASITGSSLTITVENPSPGGGSLPSSNPVSVPVGAAGFSPTALSDAIVDRWYQQILTTGPGYLYSVISGSLPPGLHLSSDGIISGAPSSPGDFAFTIEAASGICNLSRSYTIAVLAETSSAALARWAAATLLQAISGPTESNAEALVAADFDGDGILDLAALDTQAGCTWVYLGRPGGFDLPNCIATPENANGTPRLATVDFNGDGRPDLLVGSSVLLSNGDGSFQSPIQLPAGTQGFGDFNRDGRLDLLVVSNSKVSAYLARGDGTFGESVISNSVSGSATVGDFNADGNLDVAISAQGILTTWLGKGDGTFQAAELVAAAAPGNLIAVDEDGDGRQDIIFAPTSIVPADVSICYGNGDGTFQPPSVLLSGVISPPLPIADLNGDGRPDILYSDGHVLKVALSSGRGPATPLPTRYESFGFDVAIADFDGDGTPDVATLSVSQNELFLLHGNGDGTLRAAAVYSTGSSATTTVVAGDFNGDRNVDILAPPEAMLLGDGHGGFEQTTLPPLTPYATADVGADFDGDRKLDVAIVDALDRAIFVAYGKGDGTFEQAKAVPDAPAFPVSIAQGDFNGDGLPDIVVGSSQGFEVMLAGKDRSFNISYSDPAPSTLIQVADINRDGHRDLIVAGQSPGAVQEWAIEIFLGRGDGTFAHAEANDLERSSSGPAALAVVVGDFDGDCIPDLFVLHEQGYAVHHGNGDGSFDSGPEDFLPELGSIFRIAVAGDFNGDQAPDVVLGDKFSTVGESAAVLINQGDGTFRFADRLAMLGGPLAFALGDFAGNGRQSIAALDGFSGDIWLFKNIGPIDPPKVRRGCGQPVTTRTPPAVVGKR